MSRQVISHQNAAMNASVFLSKPPTIHTIYCYKPVRWAFHLTSINLIQKNLRQAYRCVSRVMLNPIKLTIKINYPY